MFEDNCRDLDYLPIYLSWNRHCGGSSWEFMTRSMGLLGAGSLAITGATISLVPPFGPLLGIPLLGKSSNDIYEAWTGNRGIIRDFVGDPFYDAIDLALIAYGGLKSVPKKNYLGNPKHDFFTKDPVSYESSFRQFSGFELSHYVLSSGVTITEGFKKYYNCLSIEEGWNEHIKRTNACFE